MKIQRENIFRQVGAKVLYYRKLTGITQEELANRIGVHRTVINKIENGSYHDNISLNMLLDIAEAMEVEPMLFLRFDDFERKLWNKYPNMSKTSVKGDECI